MSQKGRGRSAASGSRGGLSSGGAPSVPESPVDDAASTRGASAEIRPAAGWPGWAVGLATLALAYHFSAVVSGAIGVPPSSLLERQIANLFTPYHDLIDQGYAYRYYAEPPPTPVITARLTFAPGEPERVVRIPERSLAGPRMRHQRQLALANALFNDVREARQGPGGRQSSRLAAAYARKLCASNPGCVSVTLHAQQHLIPAPDRVLEHRRGPGATPFDLFDESLFTTPEWIGDFPCDGS